MFTVVLVNPEIPTNTGNIGRLTLGCGARLAVVGKPGFDLGTDTALQRAGLDYWPEVDLLRYDTWSDYVRAADGDLVLATKYADEPYHHHTYRPGTSLIFGGETGGVPDAVRSHPEVKSVCLPMRNATRAYNLANSVAVVLFEALRQNGPDWFDRTPYSRARSPGRTTGDEIS